MRKNLLLVLIVFTSWAAKAQTTYYSKAIATDFTNVASWGTVADGTGAAPGSISNADNFIIQNGAAMNLNAGNATVRALTINTGSLTVSSNTLNVQIAAQNNTELNVVTGTLTLNGGTINVNGAVYFADGSGFTHSSGTMVVDGNSGTAATSIAGASGTQVIVGFGYGAGSSTSQILTAANALKFVLTGGTIRIVDPSGSTSTSSFALAENSASSVHINVGAAHVFEFGDGVSTTPGGSLAGFGTSLFVGNGRMYAGSFNINSLATGNRQVTNAWSYGLAGNLNIIAGGEMQVTSALHIAGNILNNGTLTAITAAAINFQGFANATTSVVTTPQSVSGAGSFKNGVTSTANFGSVAIWNSSATGVTFTNANTLLSGTNTGTVSGTLTFTTGIINTGANAFILGISTATVGTLSHIAGGFTPASTFSRWYDATTAGATIMAGNEPALGGSGSYPFVIGTSKYQFALARPTVTGATGGIISVKYNHAAGLNVLGVPVADGVYNITNQTNASWVVSALAGFTAGTGTFIYAISGQNLYFASNGNSRVMKVATVVGTHQNGTVLPHGQRIAIAAADYLGTFYLGINSADMPVISAMSGAWEDPATWAGGVVPICGINVGILNTHTVTVNAAAANASSITVNAGGTLNVMGNLLTVGCVNKNNSLTNNGTLSVSGGTLVVNGNVSNGTNANFSQTGGQITVDGNDGGAVATSVPTGTAIFTLGSGTHTLSGGTLTIVDPHAGSGTTDDAFKYNHSSLNTVATTGHTLQLGDGVSTDAGGNATIGFSVEPRISSGSFRLILGNVIVHTVSAGIVGNRFVAHRFSDVTITGNLTISSGRYAPLAQTTSVAGNIVNNGEMISTGTFRFASGSGSGTIAASANAQTVSGTGVYANNATIASATGNFQSLLFNNNNATGITFNALNVIAGNPANTINASTNLTFTLGRINVVSGTSFLMGTVAAGAGSTLAYTAGGFTAGSTYGRFWTSVQTGTTFTAGAEPTSGTTARYPFIDATGAVRSVWIQRVTPTAAGITALTYTDAATVTTGLAIADGAYTVTNRYDGNWSVSTLGTTPSATSFNVAISAPGSYLPTNGNSRIINAAAVIGASTHQNGTTTPTAQRLTITLSQLTAAPLYIGIGIADIALTSKQSGNWNDVNTWSTGVLPTCTDAVFIVNTHNVTVNSAANVSKAITINIGGSLTVASGDVTVGCTLNNSPLTNNGTLTVNGGALNINGNLLNANGSFFNQAGGTIKVDGNAANVIANSVATGINLVSFGTSGTGNTLNLTGGTLTIVDPHTAIAAAGGTSNGHAFAYWGNGYRSGVSHNMRLGDGVSTEVGGNTSGFQYNAWPGSGYFIAGNLVIDAVDPLQANKRFVTNPYSIGVEGNVAVISGSFQPVSSSTLKVNGNINVNSGATLVTTGTIEMAKWGSDLTNNTSSVAATAAQFIGGAGTYANLLVTPTANLTNLTINNVASGGGVTLNVPISVSSTLTLTSGRINTTATNLLTLGISAASAGTLTYTSGLVFGPLKRWIGASIGSRIFPVGDGASNKQANINFTTAPTSGGTLTGEWKTTAPDFPNGAPLMEGALVVNALANIGYWQLDAADGLAGGVYTGTFTSNNSSIAISDFTKTVLVKRPSGGGNWVLDGTHVTTTGSNTDPVLSRTGMVGFSQFAIGAEQTLLPITLLYFKGAKTTAGNAVEWKVNCTSARVTMEIERSADARNFSRVTSVTADQVRCNLPFYFTDAQPLKAINYYRLKMIDMDGKISYSAVIAIINGDKGIEIVGMYPTVVNNSAFLSIAAAKAGKIQTTITDMSGRLIQSSNQSIAEGSSLLTVDCSALSAGVYHITGYVDGARTKTIRFIKL